MESLVAASVVLVLALIAGLVFRATRRREAVRQCTFHLREVGVRPTSLTSASVRLGFAVRNPGPGTAAIDRIAYAVSLSERPLAKGDVTQHTLVAAGSESEVPVTLELDAVTVGAALIGALLSGDGRLTIVGIAQVPVLGPWTLSIPFTADYSLRK